jgi:hypothetical protein
MKRPTFLWHAGGFAIATLLGTLLHFLHDWSGQSLWTAPFSGVNESTWEHMKLLYWPLLLFGIVQFFFFRGLPGFWWIKLTGTLTGLLLIPVLFYTYNGAFGKSPDWLNITIFYVSAAGTFLLEWRLFQTKMATWSHSWLAFIGLLLAGSMFVLFTFSTPQLPLFCDPESGQYGIYEP